MQSSVLFWCKGIRKDGFHLSFMTASGCLFPRLLTVSMCLFFSIRSGFYQGIRSVPVSIEKRPAVSAQFDLGDGSPLVIFPKYWRSEGLLQSRPTAETLTGGIGGTRVAKIAMVSTVTIAGVSIHNIPTLFPSPSNTALNSTRVLANVGLPLFSRFRVICDFGHSTLSLIPDWRLIVAPFRKIAQVSA
jgi:hypothetical protein